jgi:hypothetical protein
MIELPEGIRADLVAFITSDETGLCGEMKIKNLPKVPSRIDAASILRTVPGKGWRLMTNQEIANYLAEEREDQEDDDLEDDDE